MQVPAEGTYEVAITLIGANELRSESKSQIASTFEYVKTSMFDCAHSMMTYVINTITIKDPEHAGKHIIPKNKDIGTEMQSYGGKGEDYPHLLP